MTKKIQLIATTDIHGSIYPLNYADGTYRQKGCASLYTAIRTYRDENTILINNGDDLQGSPLLYYHYRKQADEVSPMTKVINAMGYDFNNLGNHDFNYGEDALFVHMNHCGALTMTANVLYKGKPLCEKYTMVEKAGKRIALIGVTTQYIPHWEEPQNIQNFTFADAFETVKEAVEQIHEKEEADYIVCVYHGGFERDLETGEPREELTGENEGYRMLEEIDGIDVLITGHQHRNLCGKWKNTVYTQTPDDGTSFARICIDTETDEITAEIIPASPQADPDILKVCQEEEDACQKWLDQPLGRSVIDLSIQDETDARLHKSQLITFLNMVLRDVSGADIAGNALYSGAVGFGREITMRDLISTYPFPNTLAVKEVNGKILREYLEKDAEYWTVTDGRVTVNPAFCEPTPYHFNYDMLGGVEYTIQASNPVGKRIVSLTRNGREVQDDDIFTLCINNYRAAGGGGYQMIREARTVKVIERPVLEILADWLNKNQVIDFEPVDNIKVTV